MNLLDKLMGREEIVIPLPPSALPSIDDWMREAPLERRHVKFDWATYVDTELVECELYARVNGQTSVFTRHKAKQTGDAFMGAIREFELLTAQYRAIKGAV